jgi:hypothetical protein
MLWMAVVTRLFTMLLSVNAVDGRGLTLLHYAVEWGHTTGVEALL